MPDKKGVLVRFYLESDADLIKWLEGLATGEGNDRIKAMLRAGIAASQNLNGQPTQPSSAASIATVDQASLQSALESFLPRIREIIDASLASTNLTRAVGEMASQDENTPSADLLKGHLIAVLSLKKTNKSKIGWVHWENGYYPDNPRNDCGCAAVDVYPA